MNHPFSTEPEYVFTIAISQAEAEALARGEVSTEIRTDLISLLDDVKQTPGEAIAAMARRNPKEQRKQPQKVTR